LLQGAVLGFGLVLLLGLAYLAFDVWEISVTQDRWRLWRTVIGFLPAALLVAVLEELIFRGYLLQQLMACSKALAVLGTSSGYALVHLKPGWVWPDSAMELTGLFMLGVVLALSVLRAGHLYLAIGLHASLAYWARVNKLLVEFSPDSPQWLVGTNRLVNGLVPWGLLALIGVALIRWSRRTIRV
jgi:membrane protease YdiL (CAAX protease family)